MADIQIVHAELVEDRYIHVYRTIDGEQSIHRMPKEILAIRAGEYDLEPDDPQVLDIVLTEMFHEPDDPDEIHPLFAKDTIAEALVEVNARVERMKTKHGAPSGKMRSMSKAADSDESTAGLTSAKSLLLEHGDPSIVPWVQINRDEARKEVRVGKKSLTDRMRDQAMTVLRTRAEEENSDRSRAPGRIESSKTEGDVNVPNRPRENR